jgi:hypothetical protein
MARDAFAISSQRIKSFVSEGTSKNRKTIVRCKPGPRGASWTRFTYAPSRALYAALSTLAREGRHHLELIRLTTYVGLLTALASRTGEPDWGLPPVPVRRRS